MESPHLTSPPSIRVYEFNSHHDRHRPTSRSSSHTSISSRKPPSPMTIPNAREEIAPPPLPPPKYIEELMYGNDPGWQWGNTTHAGFGKSTLAPIKPGSSLMGSYTRESREDKQDRVERKDYFRRGSSISTVVRSPSELEIKMESIPMVDEDHQQSPASSYSNHQFQGENELSQKILGPSSNAYDKHLLSKIGKPNSPPRHSSLGSSHDQDAGPTMSKLPFHSKQGNKAKAKSLSMSDSLGGGDSVSRWANSPPSSGVSPSARPTWGKDYMDYRSPSVDSIGPSSTLESDQYGYIRGGIRRSASRSIPSNSNLDEFPSLPGHSNRGSYDQASFIDPDVDFPMDETGGGIGKLHLDDRTPSQSGGHSPLSRQGMKRRASSPRQNSRDVKQQLHTVSSNGELYQPRVSGQPFSSRSPGTRYPQGSVSSTSSASLRNGSLASSAVPSIGSSITSISSLDRYSTGGISPNSDLDPMQDSPYVTPVSLNPSPRGSLSSKSLSSSDHKSTAATRKMSVHGAVNNPKHHSLPTSKGGFMCQCCPKKPKKFDSLEDLHVHEMEKQYTCQFCTNRFKNKNEAERHQNSLHLRRHSWSCGALGSQYHNAFHPSSILSAQMPNASATDACGYCGEEFPNFPQPDWDRRLEHLTNVHKFGECNQAKKFFRADHFRQHLKHSHAGTSGKWTNMLENSCMKDEPAPVPLSERKSGGGIGESGRGGNANGMTSGLEPTIDEVHDES